MRMQFKQRGAILCWVIIILSLSACYSPPDAPQQVTAVGADAEALVAWDEVPGATSYALYWNATGKDSGTDASATNVSSPYTVTGLRNESTYYFRVTALSSSGESVASPSIAARTTAVKLQSIFVAPKGQSAVPYTNMLIGTKQYFAATGVYPDGSTVDISRVVKWSTSDSKAVTIIKEGRGAGLVTALQSNAGKVPSVVAGYGSMQAGLNVNVFTGSPYILGITPHEATIAPRSLLAFRAWGSSYPSSQDYTANVVWSSSNPNVAKISNELGSEGVAKALHAGKTLITASFNGVTVDAALYVSDIALQTIAITSATLSIPSGLTQRLQANGSYSDGSTRDITDMVVWSTSNPAVALVENDRIEPYAPHQAGTVVTGFSMEAVGSAVITAQFQALSARSVVTVTPAEPLSMQISPASVSLIPGETQQLALDVTFTDGRITNNLLGATWTSSNSTVVQVDPTGLVSAVVPGHVVISVSHADFPGFSAAASIAVRMVNVDHTQVTAACVSCHDGVLATGKNVAHIPTLQSCDICHHSTTAWKGAEVDHLNIINGCAYCHNGTSASGLGGKHYVGLVTTAQCEACHASAPAKWSPARTFDHTQTTMTCAICHDGSGLLARNGKPSTHIATNAACDTCHGTLSWVILK